MPTKYKNEIEPGGFEDLTFVCHSPDPLPDPPIDYPPISRSLFYPDVQHLKEKVWDESWDGDRATWKNFEHYKCVSSRTSKTPVSAPFVENANSGAYHMDATSSKRFTRYLLWTAGSYAQPFGAPGLPYTGLPAFDQPNSLDGTFVPAPADLVSLNDRALSRMLPSIKENLSLVNSVIELKDFKSLPGLIRRFRQIVPFVTKFLKTKKSIPSLIDFLKLPAETYLTYQFALAPFIRDILGIYASLADYQAQIQDLINREGKMQTHHFSYKWHEFPEELNESATELGWDQPLSILNGPCYLWSQNRRTLSDASEFHAEIQYNYNYTAFQRTHASALRLLDRLGINFNTQIIWNALPWTFVVDWVVDVNQFLGHYGKVQNMEPMVNIHQYLWSIKRKRRIYTEMICKTNHPDVVTHFVAGQKVSHPEVTETAFRRQVGLPGISSLTASGLNFKEFSLGAALAICQARFRGPRRLRPPKPGF
jgi:hypothetical protein